MTTEEPSPPEVEVRPDLGHRSQQLLRIGARLGDRFHDVEDAAQEAWIAALKRPRHSLRNPLAWMRVALIRALSRDRERNRNRLEREQLAARSECEPSTLDALLERSRSSYLSRKVDELPDRYREVLKMRFGEDLETSEIARRLGRPEATVRTQLKRGLEELRRRTDSGRKLLGLAWLDVLRQRAPRVALPKAVSVQAASLGIIALGAGWGLTQHATGSSPKALESASVATVVAERARPDSDAGRRAAAKTRRPGFARPAANGATLAARRFGVGEDDLAGITAFGSPSPDGVRARVLGRTGEGGTVTIRPADLPAWVWLESDAYLSRRYFVESASRDPIPCDLLATAPLTVQVHAHGVPVPGADVELSRSIEVAEEREGHRTLPPLPARGRTDARGRSIVRRVPGPDGTWVTAHAPGHAPTSRRGEAGQSEVTIELAPPRRLEYTLLQPDGRPAVGASATLALAYPASKRTAVSDAEGRVEWRDVPPGNFAFEAALDGLSTFNWSDRRGDVVDTLRLTPDATVRGTLVGFRQPGDWVVTLVARSSPSDRDLPYPHELRTPRRSLVPDRSGSFAFTGARRARYDVLVHAPGSNVVVATARSARPGDRQLTLTRVQPPPLEAFTSGCLPDLKDASGKLGIRETGTRRVLPLAFTAETGAFASTALRPGAYELTWDTGPGPHRIASLDLHPGHNPAGDLLLEATGRLDVRCPIAETYRIHVRSVDANEPFDWRHPTMRTRDGARRRALRPGRYELVARRSGRADFWRAFTIVPGQTTEVEIAPEPGRQVRIFVSSERTLLPEEALTITALPGDSSRPIAVLHDRISRNRTDALLVQPFSVPLGVDRIRVETSAGLVGHGAVASAAFPPHDPTRVDIVLAHPATERH